MGSQAPRLLAAGCFIALSAAEGLTRTMAGQRQLRGTQDDSFEDRMQMYSQWTKFATSHGRSLSHLADSPTPSRPPHPGTPPPTPSPPPPQPTTPPPQPEPYPQVTQPPEPGTQVTQPPEPESQVTQPTEPAGPTPPPYAPSGPAGAGGCKVLRYHTGFANTTLYYNRTIKDTPNFGECCHRCQEDPYCVAWTRVAGGDAPNFRNCYLKYSFKALDQSPERTLGNHVGHDIDPVKYPELRYVDEGYADPNYPVILESGTIPDYYPADYYGCPYAPGNPTTPCVAPPTCNFNGDNVFVPPACIE